MNFKISQQVVMVSKPITNVKNNGEPRGIVPQVKPNTIYEVKAICYCSQCGRQKIDIGLILPPNVKSDIKCGCGNRYPSNGRWFMDAINFRLVQYQNISSEIVEKLKVTEEKSDVKPIIKKEEHEKV